VATLKALGKLVVVLAVFGLCAALALLSPIWSDDP
jgi:hypothetical protein